MFGLVLGLIVAVGYVTAAANGSLAEYGAVAVLLSGLALAVAAVVLGQLFRFTMGGAAMWAMVGAAIAAVIELLQGRLTLALSLLLTAGLFWGVQQVLAKPLRSTQKAGRSRHQGAATRRRSAVWDTARGYAHDVLPMAPTGACVLTLREDGSAHLAAGGGHLEIGDVQNIDWRTEDPTSLPFHSDLDPSRRALVLKVASSEIAVQPVDLNAWMAWLEDHGARSPVPHEDSHTATNILAVLDEGESIRASCRATISFGRNPALGNAFVTHKLLVLEAGARIRALPLSGIEVTEGSSVYDLNVTHERTRSDGAGIDLVYVNISPPGRADNQAFLRVASLLRHECHFVAERVWLTQNSEVIYGRIDEDWTFLPARYLESLRVDIERLAEITTEAELRTYRPQVLPVPDLVRGDDPQPNRAYDGRSAVAKLPRPITPVHALYIWTEDIDADPPYEEFELVDGPDETLMICREENLPTAIEALRRDGYLVRQDQAAFDLVEGLLQQLSR